MTLEQVSSSLPDHLIPAAGPGPRRLGGRMAAASWAWECRRCDMPGNHPGKKAHFSWISSPAPAWPLREQQHHPEGHSRERARGAGAPAPGPQGHGCDPLSTAERSRPCQREQAAAEQGINPMFPSPELDSSWQSTSVPVLQGHETAVNARAGGQVSFPWPVDMAPEWESGDHAAERGGDRPAETPSPGLREGDLSSP